MSVLTSLNIILHKFSIYSVRFRIVIESRGKSVFNFELERSWCIIIRWSSIYMPLTYKSKKPIHFLWHQV